MAGCCQWCGQVGPVEWHHVTGRCDRSGAYLDSQLVIGMCPSCHIGRHGIHPYFRACKLDFPSLGTDLRAFRLRRCGATERFFGEAGRPLTYVPAAVLGLARLHLEVADAFDLVGAVAL